MPPTLATLTCEEVESGTRVTNRAAYNSEEALKTVMDMGMVQGVTETWDRLAEHLAAQQSWEFSCLDVSGKGDGGRAVVYPFSRTSATFASIRNVWKR